VTLRPFEPVRRVGRGLGRDYVVGDLHGCYELLDLALRQVRFDFSKDRLFMVGDLVDRGPDSPRALELLDEPWVYAIRGNHEQLALDCYANGTCNEALLAHHVARNGMGWWPRLSESRKERLLEAYEALPFAMQVETNSGTVGLVHADVPPAMTWPQFVAQLRAGDHKTRMSALWSCSRIDYQDHSGVAGITRVYVGHKIQVGGVNCLGNVWFIDTGAFLSYRRRSQEGELSLVELSLPQTALRTPRRQSRVAVYATRH